MKVKAANDLIDNKCPLVNGWREWGWEKASIGEAHQILRHCGTREMLVRIRYSRPGSSVLSTLSSPNVVPFSSALMANFWSALDSLWQSDDFSMSTVLSPRNRVW
jgi:hypothetical protein